MTPSVGCSAVVLNGLKFSAVMSPAATVTEASLLAGWLPAAAPSQAASRRVVAVAAAAALTRRRTRGCFVGFRSIDRFLSNAVFERVTRHPPGKLAVT